MSRSTTQTISKRFKFARRVTWLSLALSVLLLGYTYYRSEIVYSGHKNDIYLKYYLILLTALLFFGIVLRLKDETKLNIVMVTTSLVTGIYLVEIALNIVVPITGYGDFAKLRQKAAEAVGEAYDPRTKYQIYRDLKAAGVDAVPSFNSGLVLATNGILGSEPLIPFAGVSKKTTVSCNENGEYSIFLSDRYGFNNPDSEWDSPQAEWVLTGDSFTRGACVQQGEDIAGQIRLITGESVLNLGAEGAGPLAELGALKEYAEFRKPKKVLFVYYEGNDMLDLAIEASAPLLLRYLRSEFSLNLIHRQTEIDSRLNKYITTAEKRNPTSSRKLTVAEAVIGYTKFLRLPNIRQRIGFDASAHPLFIKVLKQARDKTAAWGGKLYFVYLPEFMRYSTRGLNHDWHTNRGEIIEIAKNLNLPVIDIHQEVFANHPDPLALFPFRQSPHYTAEGYSEVAKAIVFGVRNEQKVGSETVK